MRDSFSVERSLPLSSTRTLTVWIGSSAPPIRLDPLRAPRTTTPSFPNRSVTSVATTSVSPNSTMRTTSASLSSSVTRSSYRDGRRVDRGGLRQHRGHVAPARTQSDRQSQRQQDEKEHERDGDPEAPPVLVARYLKGRLHW